MNNLAASTGNSNTDPVDDDEWLHRLRPVEEPPAVDTTTPPTHDAEGDDESGRGPPHAEAIPEAAHAAARRGWRVLAPYTIDATGRCACGRPACSSQGKHPIEPRWQDAPLLSGADVQATFEAGGRNLGIATGTPSGFFALDVDLDKPGTADWLAELLAGRELPTTRMIKTPGGGYHYYFAMPDFPVINSAKRLPNGIDIRGTGSQVVAPPSRSIKGEYVVAVDAPNAGAPDWLLELVRPLPPAPLVNLAALPKLTDLLEPEQRRLRAYTDSVLAAEIARLSPEVAKGKGRNITTFEVSCTLVELANGPWCFLDLAEAHTLLTAYAPITADFPADELEICWSSAVRTVAGKGRAMPEASTAGLVRPGDPLSDPSAATAPAAREPAAAAPAAGDEGTTGKGKAEKGPSQATLLAHALERYTIREDRTGTAYTLPRSGPHVARPLRGGTRSLRAQLAKLYRQQCGGNVPTQGALASLAGEAADASPVDFHLRRRARRCATARHGRHERPRRAHHCGRLGAWVGLAGIPGGCRPDDR